MIDNLRESDKLFVSRFTDKTVSAGIINSYMNSLDCACLREGNEPLVIFGIRYGNGLLDSKVSWMVATDKIYKQRLKIAKLSRKVIDILKNKHGSFVGYVDAKDKTSVKWHKWLGYKQKGKYDHNGNSFYLFSLGGE